MSEETKHTEATRPVLAASSGGWFSCRVMEVGPAEDGKIYINLQETGGAFRKWFYATPSMKKEMLDTALTAISANLPVWAVLASRDEYSPIDRLYVYRG